MGVIPEPGQNYLSFSIKTFPVSAQSLQVGGLVPYYALERRSVDPAPDSSSIVLHWCPIEIWRKGNGQLLCLRTLVHYSISCVRELLVKSTSIENNDHIQNID